MPAAHLWLPLALAAVLAPPCCALQAARGPGLGVDSVVAPTTRAVRAALVPRINDGTWRGLTAAWRVGDSLRTISLGVQATDAAAIDPATLFDLGDLGSLLLATLVADLAARDQLSLDRPVQAMLPATFRVPRFAGRAITVGDLIFHRSGLPTVNVPDGEPEGYAERVRVAIGRATLEREIGSRYEFSPLGLALLRVALGEQLNQSVDAAIRTRILTPLGITDILPSWAAMPPRRRATGHDPSGRPLPPRAGPHWLGTIVGLSRFAVAASDTGRGPLARAFALMLRTRSPGPDPSLPLALGWRVIQLEGRDIFWFNATDAPGYAAFVAADPTRQAASAVLANSARPVDAIAGPLVRGRLPVVPPLARRP